MSTIKVNSIDPRNTGETVSVNGIAMPNAGTLANRNKIINGGMRISQRGSGAATLTETYPVDRFEQAFSTDGAVSFQKETTDVPAGFNFSIKGTVTTADGTVGSTQGWTIDQKIEGYNAADLLFGTANAKSVTVSFWVKSSVAGVYCVTLRNGADDRAFVSEYTISSADTWEYKTITVAGDTSGTWDKGNSTGLDVIFCLSGGSSKQRAAGSWGTFADCTSNQTQILETLNANWLLTGVQVEAGTNATAFEFTDFATELIKCERYFQKTYQYSDNPGTATASGSYVSRDGTASSVSRYYPVQLHTRMRATPTVIPYDTLGNVNRMRLGTANNQVAGVSSVSDHSFMIFANQANASHYVGYFHWTAEAEA